MVFATAARLLGNPSDAEDIAQTVFLRAFQRFADLNANPAAPGWLKTVTRNACLNHLTRYRSRWTLFSEMGFSEKGRTSDEAGDVDLDLAADDPSAVTRLERAEDLGRLEQALAALPDAQRVPLVLFHFEEMNYQDIATTLGVSLAKVKTNIFRGREALRKVLGDAAR